MIELDPENLMAIMSLAIIDISSQYSDIEVKKNVEKLLAKAFELDHNNPLVLRYLAEHFFQKGHYEVANQMCLNALKTLERFRRSENIVKENPNFRKDLEFLKSDIYFIMGKVQHVDENYQEALNNYQKAIKTNSTNYSA